MTAVVVGASSSIGRAIAVDLAELGHDVVLWGRDRGRLDAVAVEVRGHGRDPVVEAFDLRDAQALEGAASRAVERSPSVVVWAAAQFAYGAADAADPGTVEAVLEVGVVAAAVVAHRLLPVLVEAAQRGPAALVLLGSTADRTAFADSAAYVAAKHGLRGLAEALWLDVGERGVRVCLISPGLVASGNGLDAPGASDRLIDLL